MQELTITSALVISTDIYDTLIALISLDIPDLLEQVMPSPLVILLLVSGLKLASFHPHLSWPLSPKFRSSILETYFTVLFASKKTGFLSYAFNHRGNT